jgi:hypothetical protein
MSISMNIFHEFCLLECAEVRCQWLMEARKYVHCMLSQCPGDAEAMQTKI